ncbi:MAG: HPF/RaiA family ribosome-associated protein [Gemmatimonadetes bacterium]|nr:HPF/RaiA family ribosome-associated protein [Gemmatimonadota bacterium]
MERLQIAMRDVALPDGAEAAIRAEAARLNSFYDRLVSCRVLVETPHRHLREGALYNVRIDLTLPGGELVVKRQPEKDLLSAIQRAFEAARRRLEDYARVQRGAVKATGKPARARVVRLFPYEGYGFLEAAGGREIYDHRNSVLNGGFDRMEVGTVVRFTEEEGERGPQASSVAPAGGRRRQKGGTTA